jgi:tetratricopeptide (TPR) repeat protein
MLYIRALILVTLACFLGSAITFAQSTPRSKRKRVDTQPQKQTQQTTAAANAEFDQIAKGAEDARIAGRLDEAVGAYTRALQIRPKWPDGWWYLGAILYEKDLYAQGQDAFSNLVALDPNRGPGWAMLGLCQFRTLDYERSVVSLQRSRTLGLGGNRELETVVRYHTVLLYIHFEQFEVAFEILREFVRAGNDNPKIIEAFGLTILRMPLLPNEIPTSKREEVMLAGQAGLNMAARRLDESRKVFDTLLSRYGDEPNVHYSFGVFLINQDADAALKEFSRTLELEATHQPAMVQMAFEYMKRGDYDTAMPLAEKAVQLAPKMYPARNVLGRLLLQAGQVDRAIQELEEGVRLAPSSPEMHFALSRAYARAGRQADAKREQDTFKQLQAQYEAKTNPANNSNDNQQKAKP